MNSRVRTFIIVIVTVVWALNFLAVIAIPGYQAPPEINSIFMGTVGAALATAPIVGRREREDQGAENRENNESEPHPNNTGERQS